MGLVSNSPIPFTGNLASGTPVSDLLRSSSSGLIGAPLKALGRVQFGVTRRDFTVCAKGRKVKRREYPWPQDPDPNVKGGVLTHLSSFKPLKDKPKPVTLEFEKPLMELQKKIIDVQKMANETGQDLTDQIILLENKYQQALNDIYTHLTPIQRVHIARHPNRPTFLDHIFNITDRFVELHGDRAGYDDPAMVTGLGSINGRSYMFMGHQKGRNTKESIQRNFGMPTPHGYRKALRMMYYADHHGFPIVTFIDTPGAFADLKSEELNQGEAIANNLRTMFGLKVPIITIVIGEGGSGGALAIGCANKLLMLENAVFYVASPEACAAILWKDAKAAPKAAEKLRITAGELCKLQIADGIIPEPLGGAHSDPYWTSQQIKIAITDAMDELVKMDTPELLKHRMSKFRKMGAYEAGIPQGPKKKVNMKKKETPILKHGKTSFENVKQKIPKAKGSSTEPPNLKNQVDLELFEAARAMGLEDRLTRLREKYEKARNSNDQTMTLALKDEIEKLKDEFTRGLAAAPNHARQQHKPDRLNEAGKLQQEINRKLKEILDQPHMKENIETLKREIVDSGISTNEELNQGLKETILQVKEEIETKISDVLEPFGFHVERPSFSGVEVKIAELSNEIYEFIEDVTNSSGLKDAIEELKLVKAKAGRTRDVESNNKILVLEKLLHQCIVESMNSSAFKEKYEKLKAEISETLESSRGLDGNFFERNMNKGNSTYDGSRVEINSEANRSLS